MGLEVTTLSPLSILLLHSNLPQSKKQVKLEEQSELTEYDGHRNANIEDLNDRGEDKTK
jgi:hypothetical protein